MLWAKTSGFESATTFRALVLSSPCFNISPVLALKSGISSSTEHSGAAFLISLTVRANIDAPPSSRSSLVTEVMTAYLKFSDFTAFATFTGSFASKKDGFPVFTLQYPHHLVHVSPKIRKVAVPWLQHSDRLGHFASSHIVWSLFAFTSSLTFR